MSHVTFKAKMKRGKKETKKAKKEKPKRLFWNI